MFSTVVRDESQQQPSLSFSSHGSTMMPQLVANFPLRRITPLPKHGDELVLLNALRQLENELGTAVEYIRDDKPFQSISTDVTGGRLYILLNVVHGLRNVRVRFYGPDREKATSDFKAFMALWARVEPDIMSLQYNADMDGLLQLVRVPVDLAVQGMASIHIPLGTHLAHSCTNTPSLALGATMLLSAVMALFVIICALLGNDSTSPLSIASICITALALVGQALVMKAVMGALKVFKHSIGISERSFEYIDKLARPPSPPHGDYTHSNQSGTPSPQTGGITGVVPPPLTLTKPSVVPGAMPNQPAQVPSPSTTALADALAIDGGNPSSPRNATPPFALPGANDTLGAPSSPLRRLHRSPSGSPRDNKMSPQFAPSPHCQPLPDRGVHTPTGTNWMMSGTKQLTPTHSAQVTPLDGKLLLPIAAPRRHSGQVMETAGLDPSGSLLFIVNHHDGGKATVRMDAHELHKQLVLIGVDDHMNVNLWNESACSVTGFTLQDAVGKCIDNLLADDYSKKRTRRLIQSATTGHEEPVVVRFVSMIHVTVNLRLTATAMQNVDGTPCGHVLVGVNEQELEKTNNVLLMKYRIAELTAALDRVDPFLENNDLLGAENELRHCKAMIKRSTWESVTEAAVLMSEWTPTDLHALFSDAARNFMMKMELCDVGKTMGGLIECDAQSISTVITEVLKASSKKCTVSVMERPASMEVSSIQITLASGGFTNPTAVQENSFITSAVHEMCGDFRINEDTAVLVAPFVTFVGVKSRSGSSSSSLNTTASVNRMESPQLTFLVYESNNLYRHNISTTLWGMGYALCAIDSDRGAALILQNGVREIQGALIDIDTDSGKQILQVVDQHPNVLVVLCSDNPGVTGVVIDTREGARPYSLHYKKPLTRKNFDSIASELIKHQNEAKTKATELAEKRRIFSTSRQSPWRRGKKLGSGTSADVYEAQTVLTGGMMAVKEIILDSYMDETRVKELENEIEIMCSLTHPNIIHYFHCERGERTVNLFMELASDGSLSQLLREKGPRGLMEAALIMKQILGAVCYLHERGIVHRDIKTANVLIRDGKMKLSDFGTAAKGSGQFLTTTTGTLKYMAPEVFNGEPYGTACDIWSCGILILEVMGIVPPFLKEASGLSLASYYATLEEDPPMPPELMGDTLSFVQLCLKTKQSERPTARTLLLHPFVAEVNVHQTAPMFRRSSIGGQMPGMKKGPIRRTSFLWPTDDAESAVGIGFLEASKGSSRRSSNASDILTVESSVVSRPPPSANNVWGVV